MNQDCLFVTDPEAVKKVYEIIDRGCIHPVEKSPFIKSEAEKQAFFRKIMRKELPTIVKSVDLKNGVVIDFFNDGTMSFVGESDTLIEYASVEDMKKAIEEFELIEKCWDKVSNFTLIECKKDGDD